MPKKAEMQREVHEELKELERELESETEERSFEAPNDEFDDQDDEKSTEDDLIDSVLRTEISAADIAERQAGIYLETGLYRWVPGQFRVEKSLSDKDIHPTDIAQQKGLRGKGRCFIKVTGVVINDKNRKGRFDFLCSPDKRERDGELDFSSKFYALAEELYFKINERHPKEVMDVVDMLEAGEYLMFITKGRERNFFKNFQKLNN